MRIINTETSTTIGTVTTNQSIDLATACELAGVDLDEHDIDDLHLSVYTEEEEIADAERCARESVEAGLVGGKIPTYDADGEDPMIKTAVPDWMMDGDADWLREKFGHVSREMIRAYSWAWNSRLVQASE